LIRNSEALIAAVLCGLERKNIHYLNLPFYETGKIKKNPLGK
jgi:glucosamine-6-phosphate deaminase